MNEDQEILEYLKGVLSAEQELILEDNMVVFFITDDGCYLFSSNNFKETLDWCYDNLNIDLMYY